MKKKILITGGAGFIGCNAAKTFLKKGQYEVIIFDNLSRRGTEANLEWLKKQGDFNFIKGDLRNFKDIEAVFKSHKISSVLHLAAQVAVTTSVINPREDFDINALGTFNLLEAVRTSKQEPFFIYASTNKVYGGMENVEVVEEKGAYTFKDMGEGVSETYPLDFHSPYGCSKGAADQYVRDYYRIYGMPSVVFRQSCIYGYRQFGIEDQGWIAWFMIASQLGKKITIYGDGKQVRDILFVDDLVMLYDQAISNAHKVAGKIYNIGGGPENKLSVLELANWIQSEMNQKIDFRFSDWRPGDQPVYFSNINEIERDLGWEPAISREVGMKKLFCWIKDNIDEISKTLG